MIEVLIEILKYSGIMLGASMGLKLLLKSTIQVKLRKKDLVFLPLSLLIEEGLFRVLAFWLMSFFTSDPLILIGVSSTLFALIHLGNLKEAKYTSRDIPKYLLNIGILGAILGYVYLQHGFLFTFALHLFYDLIAIGLYFLGKKKEVRIGGRKNGRCIDGTQRL